MYRPYARARGPAPVDMSAEAHVRWRAAFAEHLVCAVACFGVLPPDVACCGVMPRDAACRHVLPRLSRDVRVSSLDIRGDHVLSWLRVVACLVCWCHCLFSFARGAMLVRAIRPAIQVRRRFKVLGSGRLRSSLGCARASVERFVDESEFVDASRALENARQEGTGFNGRPLIGVRSSVTRSATCVHRRTKFSSCSTTIQKVSTPRRASPMRAAFPKANRDQETVKFSLSVAKWRAHCRSLMHSTRAQILLDIASFQT